jgi:hypothetical protein
VITGPDGEPPEKQPDKDADMIKLQANIATLSSQIAVLSAQFRLGAAPIAPATSSELAGDAEAKILKMSGDGQCAYNVMQTGGVKSQDPDAKLDLGRESRDRMAKMARKTVCLEANKVWLHDKKDFESKYGSFQKFMETILAEKRDSDTWPEFCQWKFFANKYQQVEYRIKQMMGDGSVTTYSTKMADAPQPEFVMFPVFVNNNHFNIGAVEHGGETTYLFTASQATAAGELIEALLKAPKGPSQAKVLATGLDQEELAQLLDGMLGLGTVAQDEEAFTVVEGKNSKKKKKRAERVAKAATDATKAAAKAEADAEARVAKAAAKAAVDLIGRRAGGVWAQLAHRQGGRGWDQHQQQRQHQHQQHQHQHQHQQQRQQQQQQQQHQQQHHQQQQQQHQQQQQQQYQPPPVQHARQGGQQQPRRPQPDSTPAVVVFGDGSKKSLRRAIRKLDPAVDAVITAVYKIETGTPRAILHCDRGDREVVLAILPGLRADGFGCAAYKEQRGGARGHRDQGGTSPKAQQAEKGLHDASRRAGVCDYMTAGQECPHSLRGQCKYTCYDSARQRQPTGWRR